ncbi:MAG: hypothetical protein K0Q51_453 [Rickettsiaceae bacterium]|jgi:phosphoribosyl 1,2-cyclic phosphate phosphodiesterase|nr:hypothetical protein [Rickettsiaceae bacterium]
MRIKVLGCGPSVGVPVIGCDCKICNSDSPYNKRGRSAIIIENESSKILVDFGADIRTQLLREKVKNIDAVILTHDHADHVNGIDDLKIFSYINKKPLDLFSDPITVKAMIERFPYMFKSPDENDKWGDQRLNAIEIDFFSKINIGAVEIQFFKQEHGRIPSLGFRVNNFVYSNDVIGFPQESEKFLENIDIWIIDCITETTSPAHSGLEDVIRWAEIYNPRQIYLTNMDHTMDYNELVRKLPKAILPAYDGLTFTI